MNQFTKKLAVAGVCLCMTASALTGCGVKEDSVAATVDGEKIPYSLANFIIRYNQAQYEPFYTAYGAYFGLQSGTNIWEQSMDGQTTLGDNMKDSAIQSLQNMYLLEDHMEEYDVTITAEEKAAMEDAAEAFLAANDQETLDAMSADKDTVVRMLELSTIQTKMQTAIYDTVDTEVSDEDAAQRGIATAFFSTATSADATAADASDADATAADAKDEVREKAQKALDEVKAGKEIEDAVSEVDDTIAVNHTTYGADDTELDADVKTAADALTEDGQTAEELVETDSGYYIVQLTTTLDREATDTKKEEIVSERKTEAFNTALEEWREEADLTVKQKVVNQINLNDSVAAVSSEAETEEMTPADATAPQASGADASSSDAEETETETIEEEK